MKRRDGFVSNSSSSSFILGSHKTVLQYAIDMVPYREWENIDCELIEQLRSLQDDPTWNDNAPIMFNSCNYDTLIARLGDHVYISTCNNHQFYNAFDHEDIVNVNPETAEKELGIIMNPGEATDYAYDLYDLYLDSYSFYFTHVSEEFINESKTDIRDQPKRIKSMVDNVAKSTEKEDRWECNTSDLSFDEMVALMYLIKSGQADTIICISDTTFSRLDNKMKDKFIKY